MSDPQPCRYSSVTVSVTARDAQSAPVSGASVSSAWHYKSTTSHESGTTGADGTAHLTRGISSATAGYTVHVQVTATKDGHTATASTSFTPRTC